MVLSLAKPLMSQGSAKGARQGNGRGVRLLNALGSLALFRSEMPLKIFCLAGRVNGAGLARETQAPPGKPVSTLPFQGRGFERLGTQHSCFGNCAEFSLNVSRGPGFLVCWCAAQKIYDSVSLAKQIDTNIGWFGLERQ